MCIRDRPRRQHRPPACAWCLRFADSCFGAPPYEEATVIPSVGTARTPTAIYRRKSQHGVAGNAWREQSRRPLPATRIVGAMGIGRSAAGKAGTKLVPKVASGYVRTVLDHAIDGIGPIKSAMTSANAKLVHSGGDVETAVKAPVSYTHLRAHETVL